MIITKKPTLNYRHKTLLGLLKAFGGKVPQLDFQKYLFLFTQEFEKKSSFDFVPYHYGCFSFQSYTDKRRLVEIGAIMNVDDWQLSQNYTHLDLFPDDVFNRFYNVYSSLKGNDLIKEVYRRYPYYATRSKIAPQIMDKNDIKNIEAALSKATSPCFFTIGYEGASFDNYLNRLIKNNIKVLVDVRRNPLSRKYGFSKTTLSRTLKKLNIEYIHIPQLGISSSQRQELKTQDDYDLLFSSYERNELTQNKEALIDLFNIFKDHKRIAITCFEKDVCMCHRGRIVKYLEQSHNWEYEIRHI